MKKIKYRISKKEYIGAIPDNAVLDCYLIYNSADGDGLIYMPRKIKYDVNGVAGVDKGCGCISFGIEKEKGVYVRSPYNFVNLTSKQSKLLEQQIHEQTNQAAQTKPQR